MATLEQLEQALVNADKAGDLDAARKLASAIKSQREIDQTRKKTQEDVANLGILGGIKEQITGEMRSTEETQTLPEWTAMPELNKLDLSGIKTAAGTFFANDPQEVAQIILANNPNIKIRQDEKGNFIFRSAMDNKEYAYPPGLSIGDIPKAVGQTLAFARTGAGKLWQQAAKSAAVQAGMEGVQAATGGEFNPEQVALAGVAPVVFEGAKQGLKQVVLPAAKKAITTLRPQAAQTIQTVKQAPIQQAVQQAAPLVQKAGQTADNVAPIAQAADTAPVQQAVQAVDNVPVQQTQPNLMTGEQLATTTKKAVDGVFGKTKATAVLAEQAAPDPKVVAAANRIGVAEYLQPDHVTTNQAFRELSQAVKSVPGSQARQVEMQNLTVVGQKADDLITKIGGTTDVSTLSQSVKDELAQTVSALTKQADDAYTSLRKNISAQTRGNADDTLAFVNQRAIDLDGSKNLSSLEQMVISKLSPKKMSDGSVKYPTYALIDDVRRDVGAAARQAGPFADADTGLAKQLYKLLDNDQFKIAEAAGQGAQYKVAASLVKAYKGFQDDMTALFGKQLDQSLVGKLESATVALSKGDSQKLAKIIKVIPQPMRERVVASSLNTAFGKATQNGSLNFNTFANWYEGLLQNKQSYSTLMSNLPKDARKQLSDWYRVSNSIRKATRERITTGRIQAVQQQLQDADTLISNVYSVAKRAAVGIPLEAATTSVGMPGAGIASGLTAALTKGRPNILKAADNLITSPEFVKMASEVAKNKTPSPKTVKVVVSTKKFNDFANSIKLPKNIKIREEWLRATVNAAISQSNVQENQPEL